MWGMIQTQTLCKNFISEGTMNSTSESINMAKIPVCPKKQTSQYVC